MKRRDFARGFADGWREAGSRHVLLAAAFFVGASAGLVALT